MSDLKQHMGVWLPSHEQHMSGWMTTKNQVIDGKGTYQYHKFLDAMKFTRRFGNAIDVGGHCGLWSMHLVKRFERVFAFEPIGLHRKCFELNVQGNYELFPFAAGDHNAQVAMHTTHTSSGDSWVDGELPAGADPNAGIPLRTIDSLLPTATVDFIKLDCEGYELFALRGGEELIKRSRPTIIVEQKPGRAQKYGLPEIGAVDYLIGLGAILRKEISGDFILSWDEEKPAAEEKQTQTDPDAYLLDA
jgi:FkbM family methyltransferase